MQIGVSKLQRWTMQDVAHNMAGGRFYLSNNERLLELSEIEASASLTQRRTYKVSTSITASTALR